MAVAGITALISLAGIGAQLYGQNLQYHASEKAEQARKNQMNLEATRQRREEIRRAQVGRAQATASAYNQGAGKSSALQGGIAQITNQADRNIVAINQDQSLANDIFDANKLSAKGGYISSLGSGLQSLSGAIANNADTFTRLARGPFGATA